MSPTELPTGTVTFLFTDIEGSTRMLQELGEGFREVLERHNHIISDSASRFDGLIIKNEGDGFFIVFGSAIDAVTSAMDIQKRLFTETWPTATGVRVRIGLHTGEGRLGGSDYIGIDVHRASRIGNCGHGGQILLSNATALLTEYALPEGTRLEDLGSHRLRDLAREEHLYQLSVDGLETVFPPIRTMTTSKGNLPNQHSVLVGRSDERTSLAASLEASRLVTLTGPGGVGKTSLAMAAAADIALRFDDGVWMVEVSRVVDENLLAATIAATLHITESAHESLTDTLIGRLSRANSLLILDGCEHMIEAVAALVERLLQGTSLLKILVTSREWLSLRGENLIQLQPLSVPSPHARLVAEISASESVQLFVNRARLVQPSFELNSTNAHQAAEICRRLDGIPLAIELAAARLKVLSMDQILERLGHQFALLSGTVRDVLPHQQTLETTLDWSYDFLGDAEKALFSRLSVFAGGFTLEAAERVCSDDPVRQEDVLDLLERLVETSLVMTGAAGSSHYRLLEPISHYARMKLGDSPLASRLKERHARFYHELAEEGDREILQVSQTDWVTRLDQERYNLRAALRWFLENGHHEEAAEMAGALRWFWVIKREVTEGSKWLDMSLAGADIEDATRARALNGLGLMAIRKLDFSKVAAAWHEAQDIYRRLGDERGEARQTYHLATLAWFEDDLAAARRLVREAEEQSRENEDHWALAWSMAVGGTMARISGDLPEAQRLLDASHVLLLEHAGKLDQGWSHLRLGALARDSGDYAEATERFSAGRELLGFSEDVQGVIHANAGLGAMAWLAGDHQYALELYRSVLEGFSLSEEASNNLFELKTLIQGHLSIDDLRSVVESNRDRAEWEGDAGQRVALAEYLYHIGKTAHSQGDLERSRIALVESLYLSRTADHMPMVSINLAGLAVTALDRGDVEMAARLFGLADWYASSNDVTPWPPAHEPDYSRKMAAARTALGGQAFASHTIQGEELSLDDAVELLGARSV
ncbi:MAG: adenylate/guanylate cyclase domain-containing protein [Acidimicrobiia bacterium]